jgi:hypothetical protein
VYVAFELPKTQLGILENNVERPYSTPEYGGASGAVKGRTSAAEQLDKRHSSEHRKAHDLGLKIFRQVLFMATSSQEFHNDAADAIGM